jgi:hypothetical protein
MFKLSPQQRTPRFLRMPQTVCPPALIWIYLPVGILISGTGPSPQQVTLPSFFSPQANAPTGMP